MKTGDGVCLAKETTKETGFAKHSNKQTKNTHTKRRKKKRRSKIKFCSRSWLTVFTKKKTKEWISFSEKREETGFALEAEEEEGYSLTSGSPQPLLASLIMTWLALFSKDVPHVSAYLAAHPATF